MSESDPINEILTKLMFLKKRYKKIGILIVISGRKEINCKLFKRSKSIFKEVLKIILSKILTQEFAKIISKKAKVIFCTIFTSELE